MAKFEVEGQSHDTENFSDHQKNLISSLSVTKSLISEITFKQNLFVATKKEVEKNLKKELGSKIKEISENMPEPHLKLANGKKINFSEINKNVEKNIRNLVFLNVQLSYYGNQLQVLDTAKIEYSKNFYETIRGAK